MKATISIATAVTCLFFAACESKHPESAAGTTTISWTTGDGSEGDVYVSESGQAERLFASKTPQGSGDAPWVQAGVSYEFRLYDTAHAKLLGKVVVTRAEQ